MSDWIIEGILPVGLTLLAGLPKSGKTALAMQLAAACSAGEIFGCKAPTKGKVLFLTSDPLDWVFGKWRQIFDSDLAERIYVSSVDSEGDPDIPAIIKKHMEDFPETGAIFVDGFPGTPPIPLLTKLSESALKRKIAFVISRTVRKERSLEEGGALEAAADTVLHLITYNDRPSNRSLLIHSRDFAPQWFPLRFTGSGTLELNGRPGPYKREASNV